MPKYRKKPVVIDAVQFKDNSVETQTNLLDLGMNEVRISYAEHKPFLVIKTLEGDMRADVGDYIIKGVNREFYPCKPDIFEKTYEAVTEQ